jgi:hypothetical protein
MDRQVKIWALPPFPLPDPDTPPAPPGYRPIVIDRPAFSTDRVHKAGIDNIDWSVYLLSYSSDGTEH